MGRITFLKVGKGLTLFMSGAGTIVDSNERSWSTYYVPRTMPQYYSMLCNLIPVSLFFPMRKPRLIEVKEHASRCTVIGVLGIWTHISLSVLWPPQSFSAQITEFTAMSPVVNPSP